MQTYYDAATRRWVTTLPDGSVRPATNAEALDAVSRGAQAPAGTPGPGTTSPTPALNPAPQTTDTFTGQMGAPPVPNTPAPTGWGQTPAQTNYGWGTGWHGSTAGATSPFANLTGVQQAYYQQHPDQANSLLRQWLAPNANSAFAGYITQREPDLYNQFAAASAQKGNEGLQYTDWLKSNFGQLSDQFAGQSATQRGENPLAFGGGFAGRKAFN